MLPGSRLVFSVPLGHSLLSDKAEERVFKSSSFLLHPHNNSSTASYRARDLCSYVLTSVQVERVGVHVSFNGRELHRLQSSKNRVNRLLKLDNEPAPRHHLARYVL